MCVSKENVCHGSTFSNAMQPVRSCVFSKITIDVEALAIWQARAGQLQLWRAAPAVDLVPWQAEAITVTFDLLSLPHV